MANAVRDNPERAEFVGYNPQRVRFLMLVLSGFFAGIAGGLAALNYEIATAETLSAHTSGAVILMAFVGGVGQFYGPIIGAALITVLQIAVSSVTQAWMLYFGLFFVAMVLVRAGRASPASSCTTSGSGARALLRKLVAVVPRRPPALPCSSRRAASGARSRWRTRSRMRSATSGCASSGCGSIRGPSFPGSRRRRRSPSGRCCCAGAMRGIGARWTEVDTRARQTGEAECSTRRRCGCRKCPRASDGPRSSRTSHLEVRAGERHAIIGPNGAGKSTLFNLVSARFHATRGRIELKGEDITGLRPYEINRKGLSRSFQITNIFPRLTVFDNVRCAVLWSLGYRTRFWRRLSALANAAERAERGHRRASA